MDALINISNNHEFFSGIEDDIISKRFLFENEEKWLEIFNIPKSEIMAYIQKVDALSKDWSGIFGRTYWRDTRRLEEYINCYDCEALVYEYILRGEIIDADYKKSKIRSRRFSTMW